MTKNEYRLECLKRCPDFQREVLSFHRKYPPIFVANQSPHQLQLPKWLKSLVRINGNTIIGTPKTLLELHTLAGFAAECALVPYSFNRVWPEEGSQYFAALGRSSPEEWAKDFAALKTKWGDIHPTSLRLPWTPLSPRPLLVGGGIALPEDVLVVIPIYADTTEAEKDHVWRLAMKAKRALYPADRTRRRTRGDTYAQRLQVWDAYGQMKYFRKVAKHLNIPSTTVGGLYLRACSDILGSVPQGQAVKKRRVHGFHPGTHMEVCQQCHTAARAEDFCAESLAHIEQDTKARREVEVKSGTPEMPVSRGRKRNPEGSDRQFKQVSFRERLTGSRTR